MQRSDAEKDDVDTVKGVQKLAYALIFTICGLTLVVKRDDITAMWALRSTSVLLSLLQISLFICAIGVVIRWIAATAHELQLWLRNLKEVYTPSKYSQVRMRWQLLTFLQVKRSFHSGGGFGIRSYRSMLTAAGSNRNENRL